MDKSSPNATSLFERAIELPAGAARAQFVAAQCGSDGALRQEVESLLRANDQAGGFLASASSDDGTLASVQSRGSSPRPSPPREEREKNSRPKAKAEKSSRPNGQTEKNSRSLLARSSTLAMNAAAYAEVFLRDPAT